MVQLIKAPSILGLRPTGVERLADTLLQEGLGTFATPRSPVLTVDDLNHLYSTRRDQTGIINAEPLRIFSLRLKQTMAHVVAGERFPLVLGGDCSILLGILPALKARGVCGLITLDAHADFYAPAESVTGEAADMDIALVTGRGPKLLTDIDGLGPYVQDAHVIHLGQRDEEETLLYGSSQISQTAILRYGADAIHHDGVEFILGRILASMKNMPIEGFWLHLDADVLHDDENPAVDYRLPGGLRMAECTYLLQALVQSGTVRGMSVSIYNPKLDPGRRVAKTLANMIKAALASCYH